MLLPVQVASELYNLVLCSVSDLLVVLRTLLLVQNSLREEHALQEVLYKSVLKGSPTALPPRSVWVLCCLNNTLLHGGFTM